jgi:hypothetical protein
MLFPESNWCTVIVSWRLLPACDPFLIAFPLIADHVMISSRSSLRFLQEKFNRARIRRDL